MTKKEIVLTVLFLLPIFSFGQDIPLMRFDDKIRIREAIKIRDTFGEEVWRGIKEVPFVVLLITDDIEFLLNHPYPTSDFKLSENDTVLGTKILYRDRQFSSSLLATFPAINGVNCIVVGTPENTSKSSTEWITTLLHEHFHQFQFSQPDYYKSVDDLHLSNGDESGMWMLNYPFPYDDKFIVEQYEKLKLALIDTLESINTKKFKRKLTYYLKQRSLFQLLLNNTDFDYFSLQVWQEGIARYTEYDFLSHLNSYTPSNEVTKLNDFMPFDLFMEIFKKSQMDALFELKLDKDKRLCFYALGMAEGILLDTCNPNWKVNYFDKKFYIENYFKTIHPK